MIILKNLYFLSRFLAPLLHPVLFTYFHPHSVFLIFRMQSALSLTPGPTKQVCLPRPCPCTPIKLGPLGGSKVTPDMQKPQPKPSKVTFSLELDLLARLYCTCISGKWPQDGANVPSEETRGKCHISRYLKTLTNNKNSPYLLTTWRCIILLLSCFRSRWTE